MPRSRRSRVIEASPAQVWTVIEDPHHLPRWWPGVTRVEGVDENRWTQVFTTKKGRGVRVDFHLLESTPPGETGEDVGRRRWEQEILGTPFERLLDEAVTTVSVEPAGEGTRVTIELRQRLRGYSRLGAPMLRRATKARLEEALDGLARIV
jgi:carbon monoxide dehydrogenase subunit G